MYLTILLQAASGSAQGGSAMTGLIPLLLIFLIFWLFMIRPQNKKQKEVEKARAALKPGDKVITNAGIFGKLREIREDSFIVEISENVRVRFEKTAVFSAEQPQKAADKKDSKKAETK